MKNTRKILVTSALPYANGPLHLGQIIENIQADVWVRFQKLIGNHCLFICGDDAHGTPIMISAQKQGITPEQLIQQIHEQHQADFKEFNIGFDHYYITHSEENRMISTEVYQALQKSGDITTKTIEQAFDPQANMFLPDRYVKGECPKCHAKDQYGDNCEVCGATYSPTDLINPVSVLTGATPIQKESLHYFFQLPKYHSVLKEWTKKHLVQEEMIHKLDEWFEAGLQPWDISRDAPYFGFEIPDAPNKYFYVWLDAPIGYMASFKKLCEHQNLSFEAYWNKNSEVELYHFVGKDIVYFHALFWPAMLMSANYRTPTAIFSHGFLTINGQKMSKSRGTFITARKYLEHLEPEHLRYYFASKLNQKIEDIDLNWEDFSQKVNSDLVGKFVNIASRCASFIHKYFAGKLDDTLENQKMFDEFIAAGEMIAQYYEQREFQRAIKEIMALADSANQYIDEKKPWSLAKQNGQEKNVHQVCTMGINLFFILMIYLKPVLPKITEKAERFLNISPTAWNSREQPLLNHVLNSFEPLVQRVDAEKLKIFLTP